ncbi:MFS transporter [Lichenihabitans sp. Uapishka_5]|uniref:MFS transporter n=1 Tax=Lichenihabitans sp. Uapishka_5 TaxID=3037302 RepID=UPI0029E7D7B7|nr:MFS transporter [Lichenihabitans sp. Uapishka_5]MDX7949803.1 MFS transporter [Lichenihabitans sp. Uapishka_5]
MTATSASAHPFSHPAFRLFWIARTLSSLAFQMAAVALGWLIYDRTHSAASLGFVGLAQFAPQIVLTFLVGHVADRYDRRTIVTICQAVQACAVLVLTLGILGGWLHIAGIYGVIAVFGGARAFEQPTASALLPGTVPAVILPRAVAVSSTAMQTASIIGPALGGLLYGLGPVVPFACAAIGFAAASASISAMRLERVPPRKETATLASVFSGLHFIRERPIVLGTISLDLVAVLLGGATALLPIYARDILHTGPWGLGLLRLAPALGALAMGIAMSVVPLQRHVGMKMFSAVLVFGLATLVFAFSTNVALSVAALVVLGAADNISVVIRNSLVQLLTPQEMLGRVSAVNSLFIGTSNQLGEFESGMTAALLGAVPAAAIGGLGTIAVVLLWMRLFPALRRADRFAE